jgi:6-phosphogluconate dehydrogenase
MFDQQYEIGMVGLGVMGRNLVLNIAEKGFPVVGYDVDAEKVATLRQEGAGKPVASVETLAEMIAALKQPRAVIMLVPAGPPVDAVIRDLLPHLTPGDLIIDGGNSHFSDTDLRTKEVTGCGFGFLGLGISGGESGARHGPSMMPGGSESTYERVRPIFEAAAAQVDGDPCVAFLGPRSAGHYVKMVHNGIEYGIMQLIAETYDIMKRGLRMSDDQLAETYAGWNETDVSGFLMEITAHIFRQPDNQSERRLIDVILDEAKQKGTGLWTSHEAMTLQVPAPTIDIAVAMRDLSVLKEQREAAGRVFPAADYKYQGNHESLLFHLREALLVSMIVTFAQGTALLRTASGRYEYGLKLADVARIWRGGCIIRARLLEDIRSAYQRQPGLANLLLDMHLADKSNLITTVCEPRSTRRR